MSENALESRLRAVEDEFFYQVDLKLGEQLRQKVEREQKRERLSQHLTPRSDATLDELIERGIDEHTIATLLLVPLAFVAWADGKVTDAESDVIHAVAMQHIKDNDAASIELIESWLKNRPDEKLWAAWLNYVVALRERGLGTATAMLGQQLLADAKKVAEASNGFLSFGRIAAEKQCVLDDIRDALDRP
tara:strand:- start:25577 stop:26146 length:570 start_codon:yes stop_codon:yes gene_type:complete